MRTAVLWILLVSCTSFAVGQSAQSANLKILAFGAQNERECQPQLERLRAELQTVSFPHGWTIGLACNDLSWDRALVRAGYPKTHTAFTSLKAQITVINGGIFRGMQSAYHHTIKHELGHIACNCADEGAAEDAGMRIKERVTEAQAPSTHLPVAAQSFQATHETDPH